MSALIALAIGVVCGVAAHTIATPKGLVHPLLLPGIGAAVAACTWAALIWIGRLLSWPALDPTAVASWVVLVIVVTVTVFLSATGMAKRRQADDKDLFDRLSHVGRVNIQPGEVDEAAPAQ